MMQKLWNVNYRIHTHSGDSLEGYQVGYKSWQYSVIKNQ